MDYARVIERAAVESDLILWDGGNNDFPFVRPDLHIVLVDPLRPGHETTHHPGEATLRMADIVLVAKSDVAAPVEIERIERSVRMANPAARVIRGASPVRLDDPEAVRGRRVLVIEDGPTTTHGGMPYGAGTIAARQGGALEIVDPRPFAEPEIAAVYASYPHIGPVLPALGYSKPQIDALRTTILRCDADTVISATPFDPAALIGAAKPMVRARYEFAEAAEPGLGQALDAFLAVRMPKR